MKVILEIEKEDLERMYNDYRYMDATSFVPQSMDIIEKLDAQRERIKNAVEPLLK